jgi:hypothetical protein
MGELKEAAMTIYVVVHEVNGCGCGGCDCPDLRESEIVGVFADLAQAHEAVRRSTPGYQESHWEREPEPLTVFRDGQEVAAWCGVIEEDGQLRPSPWADRIYIQRFEVAIEMTPCK